MNTMTTKKLEKLEDYLDGLFALSETTVYPVGAILIDEKDRKEILENLEKRGAVMFDESSFQENMQRFSVAIETGKTAAIYCEKELFPKFNTLFLSFTHGNMSIEISGQGRKTINPVPRSSKIILVAKKEMFDNGDFWGRVVSSVCRL